MYIYKYMCVSASMYIYTCKHKRPCAGEAHMSEYAEASDLSQNGSILSNVCTHYTYLYMYIYIEREIDRYRERDREIDIYIYIYTHTYHIYIYMHTHIHV